MVCGAVLLRGRLSHHGPPGAYPGSFFLRSIAFSLMTETFPTSLPLAIIDWQDLSRGFHGGYYFSGRIQFGNNEETMDEEREEIEITIQQYTPDRTDFFGVYVDAWQVLVTIFDCLTPDGREYHCGDDFSTAENAKEYAAYIARQFKKGNRLASVPSELIN